MRSRFWFLLLVAAAPWGHGDASKPCHAASNSSCGTCGNCIRICKKEVGAFTEISPAVSDTLLVWFDDEARNVSISDHFSVVRDANCPLGAFSLSPNETFRIFSNGSLQLLEDDGVELRISPEEYCIMPDAGKHIKVAICIEPGSLVKVESKFLVYTVLFIISAIFALLTVVTYVLNPEPKNLHAWTVLCQAGCLVFVFTGFSITYLTGQTSNDVICVGTTYVTYYFLLASFFWLNVMCVDIFLTFRTVTPKRRMSSFIPFLYAWGTPTLFAAMVIILDQTTNDETLSPGIGNGRCWFQGFTSELLYFDGPVLVLLLINVFLFGLTATRLLKLRRESKAAFGRNRSSRVHSTTKKYSRHDKDRLTLYVKLFLLMGVSWIMEIASWAIGGAEYVWYLTDAVNALRGVLIFWFCVWSNKTMRRVLLERMCCRRSDKELSAELSTRSVNSDLASTNSVSTGASTS